MFRTYSIVLLTLMIAAGTAIADTPPPPLTCTPVPGNQVTLRGGGLAELVGDILLKCEGGTPTAAGQPVSSVSITLIMPGSAVTSRLLSGYWTEALLIISDDGSMPSPSLACGAPAAPLMPDESCRAFGTGSGAGVYDGTPGHPNVFQAQIQPSMGGSNPLEFSNVLVWPGVPLDGGTHYLRFTGVRVNPPIVISTSVATSQFAILSFVPSSAVNLTNPAVTVGLVLPDMYLQMDSTPVFQQCNGENVQLAGDPSAAATPQLKVGIVKSFPTAFRTRTMAPFVDNDTSPLPIGGNDSSGLVETRHLDLTLPDIPGRGNLATAGLADSGTRLYATFTGVPNGMQLYAPVVVSTTMNGQVQSVYRMVAPAGFSGGPFQPVAGGSNGLAQFKGETGNTATVVYETLKSSVSMDLAEIPIYVAYTPEGVGYAPGTVQVQVGLGPVSNINYAADATVTIPRFIGNVQGPVNAFELRLCSYQLTTAVSPAGAGTVTPSSGSYTDGTVVNLQATPVGGAVFRDWVGPVTSWNSASTTVIVNGAVSVTARFKVPPTITWANPASIAGGTALSATQLNATASVPGTFVYTPAAGTVLTTGSHTLSVTFTPTDLDNYVATSATVTLVVGKLTPTVTWATPAPIAGGTALSATQLNATASVPGTFVYTPAAGAVLSPGSQMLSVTFTPTDTNTYLPVSTTVTLVVGKLTPAVTWATPAPIAGGVPLTATQLNATASVPGTFVYTPAAGTVLSPGSRVLSVTFTPTDANTYLPVTTTVNITIGKIRPTVTWPTPAPIAVGTALSAAQLNAVASVPGAFVYTPPAGTVLSPGSNTLSVIFTPTDTTNYLSVTATVSIAVGQLTPTLSWATPAPIPYGTPLGKKQLNATASVAGSFTYTPAAGTVLKPGIHTLSAVFTPTDTNYGSAQVSVSLRVNKGIPNVEWAKPGPMVQGTPLGPLQLNATANMPGTFVYSPAAGTVLSAGYQTLSVNFTPADSNYGPGFLQTVVQVEKSPVVDAAGYRPISLAPDAIFSLFGSGLGHQSTAASVPLPITLGGSTLLIKDSAGVERAAELLYVAPNQINFIVPGATAIGPAQLTVKNAGAVVTTVALQVTPVSPGIFSANMNGAGPASGGMLLVAADDTRVDSPLAVCTAAGCTAAPIDCGSSGNEVFLSLYGTGFRHRSALSTTTVTIGGVPVEVQYAGEQLGFAGLDQLNVKVPHSLADRGEVDVVFTVDGVTANVVRVNLH